MATGDNTVNAGEVGRVTGSTYPDYEEDEVIFESFLKEHQILTVSSPSSESSTELYEPGTVRNLRRIPCYPPLFQRIKRRRFYTDEEDPNITSVAGARRSGSTSRVFAIEIPLSELVAWDSVRGMELAKRATANTLRYLELFCRVVDQVIASIQIDDTEDGDIEPDSIDILHQQRLSQQSARLEAARQAADNNQIVDGNDTGLLNDNAILNNNNDITDEFPPTLMRRYELRILPLGRRAEYPPFITQYHPSPDPTSSTSSISSSLSRPHSVSLRNIRSQSLGRLVTLTGMLVRASDVKPCCTVATYTCDACGYELYQVLPYKREFMPQRICTSPACRQSASAAADTLHLQTRGSKFEKFQECRVQELPDQVPMGHVPRSVAVHFRGELTRRASPGDTVTIDGIFLPQRIAESGYRAMKAGLVSTTFIQAQRVVVHKRSYDADDVALAGMSPEQVEELDREVLAVATSEDPVGRLSASLAPEIYGHGDLKRALLLQSVGGCTRTLPDKMRIRGDVHICLMGDPGVAKSQLLKHVATITPRGVYTTGKGSSGVGLTAAVTKDPTTGEMALEGGALVLADRGVCAIDEFDKMDEGDRTAIHEVMEQQTVSIAKAGIVASLNARAAVLAAANPLYGRYNRSRSVSENVNLPNSLLSRFDLMFLILDVADVEKDMALARHVTSVHQNEGLRIAPSSSTNKKRKRSQLLAKNGGDAEEDDPDSDSDSGSLPEDEMDDDTPSDLTQSPVPPNIVREYIRRARKFHPVVPKEVAPYIVEAYVGLRMESAPGSNPPMNGGGGGRSGRYGNNNRTTTVAGDQTAMTPRQLLSILRLGQALARLRFSDYVAREDVDEAIRLTHTSKASITDDNFHSEGGSGGGGRGTDVTSNIFRVMKDYAAAARKDRIELKLCEAITLRKGFTVQQLQTCLEEYEALQVIQLNQTRTHVHFL